MWILVLLSHLKCKHHEVAWKKNKINMLNHAHCKRSKYKKKNNKNLKEKGKKWALIKNGNEHLTF